MFYSKRQIFKFKGLLVVILSSLSFQSDAQDSALFVRLLHDDNVDFAPVTEKVASRNVVVLGGEKTFIKRLDAFSQLSLTGSLDINGYSNYPADHIDLALRAGYIRKLGIGFQAPRLSIAVLGEFKNYDVSLRDVFVGNLSVGISKPIHERVDLAFNLTAQMHRTEEQQINAQPATSPFSRNAFDRDFLTAELSTTTYLDSSWSLPISVLFLDGDLVSVSNPDPSVLASAIAADDYSEITPGTIAYRSTGRAYSLAIGLDRSLTDNSTLGFSYTKQSGKTGTDTKYSRDLLAIEYTVRW